MVVQIFTPRWKALWFATFAVLSAMETLPFHSETLKPTLFYTYKCAKGLTFFLLGWETPLSFKTSSPLTLALLVSCGSSVVVEVLQIHVVGHSFSFLELGAKLAIIGAGFTVALMAVHDGKISFLKLRVDLVWKTL